MFTISTDKALLNFATIHGYLSQESYWAQGVPETTVRRAIEKMESIMLAGHLHTCVVDGIRAGRDDAVLSELTELYEMAGK